MADTIKGKNNGNADILKVRIITDILKVRIMVMLIY